MIAGIFALIFSAWGIGIGGVVLIVCIIAAIALGLPSWVRWGLAIVLAAYLASGYFYRSGVEACEARVKAEVERVRTEDAKTLAEWKAKVDALEADNAAAEQQLAEYEQQLQKRPPVQGCILDQGDVDAIDR